MPGKSILIVTSELVPFHYGGIGTQFKSLASLLGRHGYRVSFLSRRPENFNEAIYRSNYGEAPLFFVEVPPIQPGPLHHLVYAVEIARRFDEIYQEIRPDLVIYADFCAEGLFLLLRSGTGAYGSTKFLLTINGMNHEVISVHEGNMPGISPSIKELPDVRLLLAMEDLCVHLAPWIVSPTVCAWEEIRRRLGVDKAARILPNLVDLDLFRPEEAGVRGEPKDPLILFVGRLDRMKGPDLLLKAYFEIAEQLQPAIPRIIFIGRDCYWNEYGSTFLEFWKNRIPEKYASAISFLGQVTHDAIRNYLKMATVAVFPSRWEPFGIVCLEALAMGCPVVVSKGTGLEEVLGPALSEFAVPVTEDIRPLAQKILSFLHEQPLHISSEKIRERSKELVREAEKGWLDLLRETEEKNHTIDSCMGPLCGSLHQLLASLSDPPRSLAYLQIYFRRLSGYTESDSLRVSYPKSRWTTLKIPLPTGTGGRPLRLDPADKPGTIRIKEIVLLEEAGTEIWRADGVNHFQGCSPGGKDTWSVKNECLVIVAGNNDPQILLDCPATDRLGELHITIFSGEDVGFDIPPSISHA